jgi:hypothetical protein
MPADRTPGQSDPDLRRITPSAGAPPRPATTASTSQSSLPALGFQPAPTPEEEDAELKRDMSDMTVALVKGMLQTSYYSPEHPAAKGVALEPFRRLKKLEGRFSEVTYLLQGGAQTDEIALEGVFPDTVPLSQLIKTTMGTHFADKLQGYFKRNRLISLSLKVAVDEAEFDRFIAVFVERHLRDAEDVDDTPTRFTEQLYEREVVNVSVILEDDMVGARRKLPWRVRMAISRLRKDLRVIPLYAKATQKELREAKEQIIQDIIRPLTRPEFLKDLLVNSDLVTEDVPELRGSDIETEIIESLARRLLGSIAWALVNDLERLTWEKVKQEAEDLRQIFITGVKRNLRKVALRLAREESGQAQEVIRHLFDRNLLTFEELPPRLQQQIRVERWTDAFLKDQETAFQRFEAAREPKPYLEALSTFAAIFVELLRRGQFAATHRIVSLAMMHSAIPEPAVPDRGDYVRRAMRQLRNDETLGLLAKALELDDIEQRELVRETLVMLGAPAVPFLLTVLRDSESSAARKDAAGAIASIGPDAAAEVVNDLRKFRRNWQYARTLILLLGDLQCEEASADIIRFATNPNNKLREAALIALHAMRGRSAETQLLAALSDPEIHIQRRALVLLNAIASRHTILASYVAAVLRPRAPHEDDPPLALQKQALDVAVRLGNVPVEDTGRMEHVMAAVVRAGQPGALQRLFRGHTKPLPDELRAAAADALGRWGTRDVEDTLQSARKDRSDLVRERVTAAISAIRVRTAAENVVRSDG